MPDRTLEGLSVASFRARWETLLTPPSPRRTLVAIHGSTLAGFVASGPSRDENGAPAEVGELYGLYVLSEYWGLGVDWRLWRVAREDLLGAGYEEVTLWVLEANTRARRFYERVGFRAEPGMSRMSEHEGVSLAGVRYRLPLRT